MNIFSGCATTASPLCPCPWAPSTWRRLLGPACTPSRFSPGAANFGRGVYQNLLLRKIHGSALFWLGRQRRASGFGGGFRRCTPRWPLIRLAWCRLWAKVSGRPDWDWFTSTCLSSARPSWDLRRRIRPWYALNLGRCGLSRPSSSWSRYTTYSSCLHSIIYLACKIGPGLEVREKYPQCKKWFNKK